MDIVTNCKMWVGKSWTGKRSIVAKLRNVNYDDNFYETIKICFACKNSLRFLSRKACDAHLV